MKEPDLAPAEEEGRILPSLKSDDVFVTRFRVENELGRGLLGRVYLVKHIKYGQKFVLKVFYPGAVGSSEARERFREGFKAIKKLKDPGVAKYFEQGEWEEGKTLYCTSEYLSGSTLRSLMLELKKQGKQFSALDVVQIVIKLLETLKNVHDSGAIHLNIKPENVLIVTQGRAVEKVHWDVRLCDFAFAQAPVDWFNEVSAEKLPYLAPELRGYGGELGPGADIYAVGALLYEMLTGTAPDFSMTPPSARRPSLPKKFDDIIELCLAEMPPERYRSVGDLLRELRELPAIIPFEEEKTPRSAFTPIFIILGLALLAGVIGYIMTLEPEVQVPTSGPEYWEIARNKARSDPNYIKDSEEVIAQKTKEAPEGMVYIPAGSFLKGTLPGEPNASPGVSDLVLVEMPGYYIDKYEFPAEEGKLPMVEITWGAAQTACNKLGKRLCRDIEWERACKGKDFLIYSYGDTFDPEKCPPLSQKGKTASGSAPECMSSYGVFDMSGGVAEWTLAAPENNQNLRVTKGGQLGEEIRGTRCAASFMERKELIDPNIGFRCCR